MDDVRLIDANALEKLLSERANALADEHGWHDHYTTGFDDARTYVEAAPTIDAVHVVRCRNCRLWRRTEKHYGKCPFLIGEHQYTSEDGFCNLGEKMDAKAMDAHTEDKEE